MMSLYKNIKLMMKKEKQVLTTEGSDYNFSYFLRFFTSSPATTTVCRLLLQGTFFLINKNIKRVSR